MENIDNSLTLRSLQRLRIVAALAQIAVVCAVAALDLSISILPGCALAGLTLLSSALVLRVSSSQAAQSKTVLGAILLGDVLLLSLTLYCYGGFTNPFSVLYLLHVTLAAMLLDVIWVWAVALLSLTCYSALFWWFVPVAELSMHQHHESGSAFSFHLTGMLIAFFLVCLMLAGFLTRLLLSVRDRERRHREIEYRNGQLASLATLAAGAAHELSTPLASIALAAGELSAAEKSGRLSPQDLRSDLNLIVGEVQRCSTIMRKMSARFSEGPGEVPSTVSAVDLQKLLSEELSDAQRGRVRIVVAAGGHVWKLPKQGILSQLKALIQNALDASAQDGLVTVTLRGSAQLCEIVVQDQGAGMDARVLRHAGEPFFTTKEPGKGMGLGIYLTRMFTQQCGGSFNIDSSVARGTTVTLSLPQPLLAVNPG